MPRVGRAGGGGESEPARRAATWDRRWAGLRSGRSREVGGASGKRRDGGQRRARGKPRGRGLEPPGGPITGRGVATGGAWPSPQLTGRHFVDTRRPSAARCRNQGCSPPCAAPLISTPPARDVSGPARCSHLTVALLGAAAARPAGHGPSAPGSGPRPGPAAAMALKMVKGSIDRMFDKNLQDLVRGIRNHKEDEVSDRRVRVGGGGEGAASPGAAVLLGPWLHGALCWPGRPRSAQLGAGGTRSTERFGSALTARAARALSGYGASPGIGTRSAARCRCSLGAGFPLTSDSYLLSFTLEPFPSCSNAVCTR